jgi:hypothetical protein
MEFPRKENGQVTQDSEVREDGKQIETSLQKVSKSLPISGEILFMCSKLREGDCLFHDS